MIRRVIAFGLFLLHLAFIALPEVQLWHYIALLSHQTKSNEIAFNKKSNSPLTGDHTYLNALIDRAKDSPESQQEKSIPEITISHTGLIYLAAEVFNCDLLHYRKLNCPVIYNRIPRDGILQILAPPPKFVFA